MLETVAWKYGRTKVRGIVDGVKVLETWSRMDFARCVICLEG